MNQTKKQLQPDYEQESEQIYTVKDIAAILKISQRGAYNFVNSAKEFKVFRIGRCLRVGKESFDNWLNGKTAAAE